MRKANLLGAMIFSVAASPLSAIANSVTVLELDSFHGLAPGSIGNIGLTLPPHLEAGTQGSAYKNNLVVQSGDIFSFSYKLLTDEVDLIATNDELDDYAYITLGNTLILLNHILGPYPFSASPTIFIDETATLPYEQTLTTTGSLEFGIGIVDQGDTEVLSGLLIDNITLTRGGSVIYQEGFEAAPDGLVIGDAYIVDAEFGSTPPGGLNQLLISNYAPDPVPVPAAVWLFGSGLLALVGIARRKKA
jgi:hypothetical protein